MKTEEELLKAELLRQLELFRKSIKVLSASYERCSAIGVKEQYAADEMEAFDALTSRFARAGDILVQKIFRLFDELELEEPGSIIDRINRAEKRNIIKSAESLKEIKKLRNRIAHDYAEDLLRIFGDVVSLSPTLISTLDSVESYSRKYFPEK